MIFSSTEFIFAYLPLVFFGYFGINKLLPAIYGKMWLCLASLFFYGYWSASYLPLLLASIIFNYFSGFYLSSDRFTTKIKIKKKILAIAIIINLGALCYYKYTNFFIENLNTLSDSHYTIKAIELPLGISFFTFTQIAFLVDSFKGKVEEYNFANYTLFVTFFPHLIAGPIIHHGEMMPQFARRDNEKINHKNITSGLLIFSIGLIKKILIADTFAVYAERGYTQGYSHDFFSSWATSLSYTFKLYFDFSGYCDMAIGAALLFNILLPINFNSPYKALDIQDFWRRWHITLGRYLRDYVYIPLGGNKVSPLKNYFNLFATFTIAGLWHGASWMFVMWGAVHGLALIIHRIWKKFGLQLPAPLAWCITFIFINFTWILFRSPNFETATKMFENMLSFSQALNVSLTSLPLVDLSRYGAAGGWIAENISFGVAAYLSTFLMVLASLVICSAKNSQELALKSNIGYGKLIVFSISGAISVYFGLHTESAVFLYFNF